MKRQESALNTTIVRPNDPTEGRARRKNVVKNQAAFEGTKDQPAFLEIS